MSDTEFSDVVKKIPKCQVKKKITDMSPEEKIEIINELNSKIESEFYDVKNFKNGRQQLIKKKSQHKTLVQKAKENTERTLFGACDSDGIRLTNDQWIIQNIIDIKSENAILRKKLEKYKKKMNDLYITAEDEELTTTHNNQEPIQEQYQEPIQEQYQEPIQEPIQEQPRMSRYMKRR